MADVKNKKEIQEINSKIKDKKKTLSLDQINKGVTETKAFERDTYENKLFKEEERSRKELKAFLSDAIRKQQEKIGENFKIDDIPIIKDQTKMYAFEYKKDNKTIIIVTDSPDDAVKSLRDRDVLALKDGDLDYLEAGHTKGKVTRLPIDDALLQRLQTAQKANKISLRYLDDTIDEGKKKNDDMKRYPNTQGGFLKNLKDNLKNSFFFSLEENNDQVLPSNSEQKKLNPEDEGYVTSDEGDKA